MASIRVAAVGSTAPRAAASALVTSGTDGGEASVRAVSEGRVSGDDVGRFVLTGPDPPFLPESHQIPSRRLYPGSAVANAGRALASGTRIKIPGSDASQDQGHSPPTPTPTELPLDANPLRGTACPRGSPPAASGAARRA